MPLQVNLAGQYVVHVVSDVHVDGTQGFAEVMSISRELPVDQPHVKSGDGSAPECPPSVQPSSDAEISRTDDAQAGSPVTCQVWTRVPWLSKDGPRWDRVVRRIVRSARNRKVISDQSCASEVQQVRTFHPIATSDHHVVTEFHFVGPARGITDRIVSDRSSWKPSRRQVRQLTSQAKVCHEACSTECMGKPERIRLMEAPSPPRFAPGAGRQGFQARSYDLKTGL